MTPFPQKGDRAPQFALPDHAGLTWDLDGTLRRGAHVVLIFLRHLG